MTTARQMIRWRERELAGKGNKYWRGNKDYLDSLLAMGYTKEQKQQLLSAMAKLEQLEFLRNKINKKGFWAWVLRCIYWARRTIDRFYAKRANKGTGAA